MATLDQHDRYATVLRMQQAEFERDRDERQMLWIFLWILFGFKMVSVGILIWWIEWELFVAFVGLTTWPWLIIPGAALAGPALSQWRKRRMRKRRAALRRAEFELDSGAKSGRRPSVNVIDDQGNPLDRRERGEPGSGIQESTL